MRDSISCCAVIGVALILIGTGASGADKLPRGEDVVYAEVVGDGFCVHNAFQSNMVIQRDKPIRIWGWAAPGEQITVSFADQEESTTAADDRSWTVVLPALPASAEPREMRLAGTEKALSLENVLVGDVWLLGGQSNMEHPISRVEDGDLEIASANFPNVRVLTVPAMNGAEPRQGFARLDEWSSWWGRHYRKGDWDVCTPDIARELSAIGYVFARRLYMVSQVPIGVIDASRGGTTVETWTPDPVLRQIDTAEVKASLAQWDQKVADFDPQKDLEEQITKHEQWVERMTKQGKEIPADRKAPSELRPGPANDQNRPGNCYASMLAPLAGLQIKGAIWHQGYNNALQQDGHIMYGQVFPKMIAAWRAAFNDPELPFGIISLCTAGAPQTMDNYLESMVDEGVYIRAVQYQVYRDLVDAGDKAIGFVSSYDMRRSWYHPGLKVPVGERIARWALATQYAQKVTWQPPEVVEMKAEDGQIVLSMNTTVGAQKDSPMEGFAIAGEDRRFQPAKVDFFVVGKDSRNRPQLDRKKLVLSSSLVPQPVHYRYAWGRNPMGNLSINGSGAPLPTQRSDSWTISEVPVQQDESLDHRSKLGRARALLKEDDLKRRLHEAQTLLDQHSTSAK